MFLIKEVKALQTANGFHLHRPFSRTGPGELEVVFKNATGPVLRIPAAKLDALKRDVALKKTDGTPGLVVMISQAEAQVAQISRSRKKPVFEAAFPLPTAS